MLFVNRWMIHILVLWQLISVGLMAVSVWPTWLIWLNLGFILAFIALKSTFDGIKLVILSLPFFVALPLMAPDGISMWRVVFPWVFLVWIAKDYMSFPKPKAIGNPGSGAWSKLANLDSRFRENDMLRYLIDLKNRFIARLAPWDKIIIVLFTYALISGLWAEYPLQTIKQVIFAFNIYLFYIVLLFTIDRREQIISIIKTTGASLGIIVALGYVQLILTFFTSQYYFWQYWAIFVSKLYYGLSLAKVLAYSNSWFSYTGESESLRMFSIMPDSHSFGLIAVLLIAFTLPLIYYHVRKSADTDEPKFEVSKLKWYDLWSIVRFSGLALILSGTRAVWVGMLFPLAVAAVVYARNFFRNHMRQQIIAYGMIIILFALSPFIHQIVNTLRAGVYEEEFLQRAKSIYDLSESSNIGRLLIWNESLQYAIQHPLGTGYGNFLSTLVGAKDRSSDFTDNGSEVNKRYNLPQKYVSAHSIYLQFLVELGAVGVLLFFAWWGTFFKTVWHWLKAVMKSRTVAVSFVISFSLTMMWLLAYGLFDVTFFNDKIWIYTNVGLALVAGIIRSKDSRLRGNDGSDGK